MRDRLATAGPFAATMRLLRFAAGAVPGPRRPYRLRGSSIRRRDPRFHGVGQDFRSPRATSQSAKSFTATVVASLSIGVAAIAGAYAFINAGLFPRFPGVDRSGAAGRASHRSIYVRGRQRAPSRDSRVQRRVGDDAVVPRRKRPRAASLARRARVDELLRRARRANGDAGRGFLPSDGQAANAAVAVIGHQLARRLFGTGAAVDRRSRWPGSPCR